MKHFLAIGVALSALLSACATPEAVLLKVDPVTLRPPVHVRVNVGAAKVAGSEEFKGNPLVVPFVDQDPLIFEGSSDERSRPMITWRLPEFLNSTQGLSFPKSEAVRISKTFDAEDVIARRVSGVSIGKKVRRDIPLEAARLVDCEVSPNRLELTCGLIIQKGVAFKYELRFIRSNKKDQEEEEIVLDPTGVMPK